MKSKFILTIGLLAIVLGIATTGIAIHSVQAVTPDPVAIKKAVSQAAGDATANSLRQTAAIINSNPGLSDQAKNTIAQKLNNYANFVSGNCGSVETQTNEACP